MLESVDLGKSLDRKTYKARLLESQLALRSLAYELYANKRSLVLVYEGWDAAGKGGSIRRLTEILDPRGYAVHSITAPHGEDRTHHYLWRFWRRLEPPEEKQIVIFDRSWYGRVLVERVEGFASEEEWRRAYREINEFERQLADADVLLAKFWYHISKEEQRRRFEARRDTPHKRWKLTEEDYRNREKWELYSEAVEEMLVKTSTLTAPWTVIEGEDKLWARVKTLRCLGELLASDPELASAAEKTRKKK
jgi:polyphosphate kinase 2 (PPK2 family)